MGAHMKTTIEIPDPLFRAAQARARRERTTLRALVERGLQLALAERGQHPAFRLPDASVDGRGLSARIRDVSDSRFRDLAYDDDAE
jgi:hypothetical protein